MKRVGSLAKIGLNLSIAIVVLFWATSAAANNGYEQVGLPVLQQFTAKQIGGINQNWALTQDNKGLIYNATGVGISVWDGHNWRFTRTPNRTLVRSMQFWKDDFLYAGTIDNIGYYAPNLKGELTFSSLISHWSDEDKQFGEVWFVAANDEFVVFVTDKRFIVWNGTALFTKPRDESGRLKLFEIDNKLLFKRNKDSSLLELTLINNQVEILPSQWRLPANTELSALQRNQQNKLIALTLNNGIYLETASNMLQPVSTSPVLSNKRAFTLLQASDGYYYVTTLEDGIFILNDAFEPMRQYTKAHGLAGNRFYSAIEDAQGNIWFAGVPNVLKMKPPHQHSLFVTDSVLANRLKLFQGKLTKAGYGIYQMRQHENKLTPPTFAPIISNKRLLWDFVEYHGHLIYAGRAGVVALPILPDGSFDTPVTLINEIGKVLLVDKSNGKLYASTMDGLWVISSEYEQLSASKVQALLPAMIYMTQDNKGVLWGGTASQELYKIEHAAQLNGLLKVTKFGKEEGVGPNNVVPYLTSQGLIIGTNDGFLTYHQDIQQPLQFSNDYPVIFNTPNIDVFKLYEDSFQRLWYRTGTYTGFVDFATAPPFTKNETMFKPLIDNGYKGFYSEQKDVLWFITANGEIHRMNVASASKIPAPSILNIRSLSNINSEDVLYGGMGQANIATLDQTQNSLSISFALADNINQNPSLYRHRLLGSNNQNWSRWSQSNKKEFTQLPGKDYTFEVEAKDAYGQLSRTYLKFSILPPWYLTTWAWLAYISLFVFLIAASAWLGQRLRTKVLVKRNQELASLVQIRTAEVIQQAKLLEQQQAQKDRFFANMSHEFRTPITLIQSPLQDVLKNQHNLNLATSVQKAIESAVRNSKKLLDLIGQILDFQKLDSGQARLQAAKYDLNKLLMDIIARFEPWANHQHQTLTYNCNLQDTFVYFDWRLLDTCIANLVSNALKYSQASVITVNVVEASHNQVAISVCDNGKGIKEDDQPYIFDRFYQGNQSQELSQPGTGIGLSLVKEITKLHKGSIILVNNQPSGCCFTLSLNRGNAHLEQYEILNESLINSVAWEHQYDIEQMSTWVSPYFDDGPNIDQQDHIEGDKTTLLIVDDNLELLDFIKRSFSSNYRIILAENGLQGLHKAESILPDLIISDVMMPVMTGLEMLERIKASANTQTIPVILLTAKSTKRETVEGILSGADDYMTKPFDTSELLVRVESIINGRKAIREKVRQEFLITNDKKQTFEIKMIQVVQAELNDPHFGPEALASIMAMSQRTLLRHCKQTFSLSIVQFIQNQRLEMAKALINTSEYGISEAAYACGFESQSYFSKVFKKHFGYAPSVKTDQ